VLGAHPRLFPRDFFRWIYILGSCCIYNVSEMAHQIRYSLQFGESQEVTTHVITMMSMHNPLMVPTMTTASRLGSNAGTPSKLSGPDD
jgi:hypothetical protein